MREIKFRAWDKKNNIMLTIKPFNGLGRFMEDKENVWIMDEGTIEKDNYKSMRDVILMQFTGRKDKNGKEIYEDDIIGVWDALDNPIDGWKSGRYIVIFETAQFLLDKMEGNDGMGLFQEGCELEIIGNIHENKNLVS